ncbi:MAG: glycosyltransferase family 4 protein [Phycisphaerae bacterium]
MLISTTRYDSARPLRIAVIGGRGVPSNYSGVETVCAELYSRIAERGHRVSVYCRPQVRLSSNRVYRGIRQVRTPAPGGKNFETLSHTLTSLTHALTYGDEGNRFDLVCLYTLAPHLFAPLCKAAGVPVVGHIQGLDWQRAKWKGLGAKVIRLGEAAMLRYADALISPATFLCDHYERNHGRSCTMVPNGVPAVQVEPDAARLAALGLEAGKYIACIGRLVPEKRVQDVIHAFRAAGDFGCKLAIVGDGSTTPDYVRQLHAAAAGDARIVFTGLQRCNNLESIFAGARLFVSASELEGLPVTMLEAMSHGLPVLASRIPPHEQLLSLPGYDLFFAPADVAGLTAKLDAALGSPEVLRATGEALREQVRRHFDWAVIADATIEAYRRTVQAHRNRRERPIESAGAALPSPA